MPRNLPPELDFLLRRAAVGLGKVASRAIVNAGKSVVSDVDAFGREVQRRARAAKVRLEKMAPPGPEEEDE